MKGDIKWRPSDLKKLSSYVRKFNASLTNFARKNPELADQDLLPERLDVVKLREEITTRRQYNQTLKSIDRWFVKKNREVVKVGGLFEMLRYNYNELRYAEQRLNAKKRAVKKNMRLSKSEEKAAGLQEVSIKDKIEEIRQRLEDRSPTITTSLDNELQGWNNFLKSIKTQDEMDYLERKNAQFFYNYHKALYENFTDEQARNLNWMITDLGIDGYQLFLMTIRDPSIDIEYTYGAEDRDKKYEHMIWRLPELFYEMVNDGTFILN